MVYGYDFITFGGVGELTVQEPDLQVVYHEKKMDQYFSWNYCWKLWTTFLN